MKNTVTIIGIAVLIAFAVFGFSTKRELSLSDIPPEVHIAFSSWKMEQGRLYGSPEENNYRLKKFQEVYEHIKKVNGEQDDFELGLNQFSDLSEEEFIAKYTGNFNEEDIQKLEEEAQQQSMKEEPEHEPNFQAPNAVDWQAKGAFLPPVSQGACGSCWAFASIAAFESAYFIKKNEKIKFSEQYLVNCDLKSNGCKGGSIHPNLFKQEGVIKNSMLKYVGRQGPCEKGKYSKFTKASSFKVKAPTTTKTIKDMIAIAPGYVVVNADRNFQTYKSGILTSFQATNKVTHGVVAMGYDSSKGFIKIRNSWGAKWGENGYMRMKLNEKNLGTANIFRYYSYFIF